MAVIEGTSRLKSAVATYSFARDGGATGAIVLSGVGAEGAVIPAGSVVTGGYLEVTTTCTSGGSATVAPHVEGAADILSAASGAVANLTAGRKSVIPAGTGTTSVKTTVARNITATIATAALTAGAFRVVLFYV